MGVWGLLRNKVCRLFKHKPEMAEYTPPGKQMVQSCGPWPTNKTAKTNAYENKINEIQSIGGSSSALLTWRQPGRQHSQCAHGRFPELYPI
jgi:hypothetical protein